MSLDFSVLKKNESRLNGLKRAQMNLNKSNEPERA